MGNVDTITFDKFPKQSDNVGERVSVCFHYDTTRRIRGTIVRDDLEHPFIMIIKLDNDRHVLASECQYHYQKDLHDERVADRA